MAVSALKELVGNDPRKVDELVSIIAGLVHSFFTERRRKGEKHAAALRQNQGGAFEPSSDCLHTSINIKPGSVS